MKYTLAEAATLVRARNVASELYGHTENAEGYDQGFIEAHASTAREALDSLLITADTRLKIDGHDAVRRSYTDSELDQALSRSSGAGADRVPPVTESDLVAVLGDQVLDAIMAQAPTEPRRRRDLAVKVAARLLNESQLAIASVPSPA